MKQIIIAQSILKDKIVQILKTDNYLYGLTAWGDVYVKDMEKTWDESIKGKNKWVRKGVWKLVVGNEEIPERES